jgi:hypothetical protein
MRRDRPRYDARVTIASFGDDPSRRRQRVVSMIPSNSANTFCNRRCPAIVEPGL